MSNTVNILSTASLSDVLVKKAATKGITLTAIPFINILPRTDDQTTKKIRELVAMPVTVVFTSANAVHAVTDILNGIQPKWTVYCIGHATKKAVLQYFQSVDIKGVADDTMELSKVIATNKVAELDYFCGDKRLDTLPAELKTTGVLVKELVVYYTEERPVAVAEHYDGILFFSPSAVESFFSMNTIAGDTVLFAIGHTTAAAVKEHASNKLIIGTAPAKEQLLDDAIEYFQQADVSAAQ